MQKLQVIASDGSVHFYPEGFTFEWKAYAPGVLVVYTENGSVAATFFRPIRTVEE